MKDLKSISNEDFFNDDNKNLRDCIEVIEKHIGKIELVSFGLAPNPFGFCYEILDHNFGGSIDIRTIENSLDSLSSDQENVIKELYL